MQTKNAVKAGIVELADEMDDLVEQYQYGMGTVGPFAPAVVETAAKIEATRVVYLQVKAAIGA